MSDLLQKTMTLTRVVNRSVLDQPTAAALHTLQLAIVDKLKDINYQPNSSNLDASQERSLTHDSVDDADSMPDESLTEDLELATQNSLLQHARNQVVKELDTSNYMRKRHTYTEEEKRYKCGICDYRAHRRDVVRGHMRTHSNERPFACSVCSYRSKDNQGLTLHMRRHTGERPYKCGVCEAAFTGSSSLIVHMRSHTGEKPYKCPYCPYASPTVTATAMHINAAHLKERPYKCKYCNHRVASQSSLYVHERIHAKAGNSGKGRRSQAAGQRELKCGVCDFEPKTGFDLFQHLGEHERNGIQLQTDTSCNYCDFGIAHPGQFEGLRCQQCDFTSSKCYEITKHTMESHGPQFDEGTVEIELATSSIIDDETQ